MKPTIFILIGLIGLAAAPGRAQTNLPPGREDVLAVVVHRSNPITNISFEDLRKLCLAEHQHWDNGRKITVALRETGQAERDTVLRAVYRMNENEFSRYFFRRAFVGDFGTTPKQLTTATGIRRFVFNVPGAIGFIRASELDESVKLVLVDGHQPSETGYPLALRVKEPEP